MGFSYFSSLRKNPFIHRNKRIIIYCTVIFFLLGTAVYFLIPRDTQTSTVILLRFDNLQHGRYPDGSAYDKSDIISPSVLQDVIDELGLEAQGVDTQMLQAHLEVIGLMERSALQEAEQRQAAGEEFASLVPSQLRINFLDSAQLDLDHKTQEDILSAVIDSYDQQVRVRIGLEAPLPSPLIESEQREVFDYPFLPELMHGTVQQYIDYLERLEERGRGFVSPSLGYSFGEIIARLERLRSVEVPHIRAIIRTNRLARDEERAIRRYEEVIEQLQSDISRKEGESSYARELLSELEGEREDLPEGLPEGTTNIVDVLIKHDYHSDLLRHSLEAGEEYTDKQVEVDYYLSKVEELKEGPAVGDQQEIMAQVDERVDDFLHKVGDYREIIDTMRREYLSKEAERTVVPLRGPETTAAGRGYVPVAGAFTFLGLLGGLAFSYYRDKNKHD